MPSDTCPDLCSNSSSSSTLVHSLFSSTYSVRSGPVSLLVADFLNKTTTTTNLPPSNAPPTTGLNPSQPATMPGSTPPASQIPSVTSTNTNTTASQGKR